LDGRWFVRRRVIVKEVQAKTQTQVFLFNHHHKALNLCVWRENKTRKKVVLVLEWEEACGRGLNRRERRRKWGGSGV